jgi:hypothetical protein
MENDMMAARGLLTRKSGCISQFRYPSANMVVVYPM